MDKSEPARGEENDQLTALPSQEESPDKSPLSPGGAGCGCMVEERKGDLMTQLHHQTHLSHDTATVIDWHRRPGALTRFSPHWAMSVEEETPDPYLHGSISRMRICVPGSYGKVTLGWTACHEPLADGEGFADWMVSGPMGSWRHEHRFETLESGDCVIDDQVTYSLPGPSLVDRFAPSFLTEDHLRKVFAARGTRVAADLAFHARYPGPRKRILIGGATGMIGTQVAALLSSGGHEVRRLVRSKPRGNDVEWNPSEGTLDPQAVAWADVVIHLGGASIARPFTASAKKIITESRISSTKLLATTICELPEADRPEAFITASGINYYGFDEEDTKTEGSDSGEGFLGRVCRAWESAAQPVTKAGVRHCAIRTGIVLSTIGGALAAQLPLFAVGAGGRLGPGTQMMSWISLDDIARVYAHAALTDIDGPINAVAPEPVPQKTFADRLAAHMKRPAFLPVPAFAPRLVLGRGATDELLLCNLTVAPTTLRETGYRFMHSKLDGALFEELGS